MNTNTIAAQTNQSLGAIYMIIACGAEKGGVGKSTLAVNLAVRFTQEGASVVLVDTDTTKSATHWGEVRKHYEVQPALEVVGASSEAWPVIRGLATQYDVVVVDVGARDYAKVDELAKRVDLWVTPTGISQQDLDSTVRLSEWLRGMDRQHFAGKVPLYTVLNATPAAWNSSEAAEAREYLAECAPKVPVLQAAITNRKPWRDVFKTGRAVFELPRKDAKAVDEFERVYAELLAALEAQRKEAA